MMARLPTPKPLPPMTLRTTTRTQQEERDSFRILSHESPNGQYTATDQYGSLVHCLADHLAGHAVELQQIAIAGNEDDGLDVDDVKLFDYVCEQAFLRMVKELHGPEQVVVSAEQCGHNLKNKSDRAIEEASDLEAEGVLWRQRGKVEFGEQVLPSMRDTSGSQPYDGK